MVDEFKFIIKILILVLIPSILTFIEPDTGAVIMYIIITFVMLFIGGFRKRWFILTLLALVVMLGGIITLYKLNPSTPSQWKQIATGKTDVNGRISNFLPGIEDNTGIYMLKFYTEPYFLKQGLKSIYPFVEVIFRIEGKKHYHIPITMSANGYSTYRGN